MYLLHMLILDGSPRDIPKVNHAVEGTVAFL